MEINVFALIRTFKLIEEDLGTAKGSVVTVSSIAGSTPLLGGLSYNIGKAAQDKLVQDLALHGSFSGIRVNSVAPAAIETPIFDLFGDLKGTVLENFAWRHALKRNGHPDEVGHMMALLLSDKSGFTTGQVIKIDGGASLLTSTHDIYSKILHPPEIGDAITTFA